MQAQQRGSSLCAFAISTPNSLLLSSVITSSRLSAAVRSTQALPLPLSDAIPELDAFLPFSTLSCSLWRLGLWILVLHRFRRPPPSAAVSGRAVSCGSVRHGRQDPMVHSSTFTTVCNRPEQLPYRGQTIPWTSSEDGITMTWRTSSHLLPGMSSPGGRSSSSSNNDARARSVHLRSAFRTAFLLSSVCTSSRLSAAFRSTRASPMLFQNWTRSQLSATGHISLSL